MEGSKIPLSIKDLDGDDHDIDLLNAPVFADRWGVVRDQYGPFWPVGLGPLGPTPNFPRNIGVIDGVKARAARAKVLLKLANLFTANEDKPMDGQPVTFKRPIVVYDTDLSPTLKVRMRKFSENSSPLMFESRFESGNLQQARRM